MKRPAGEAGEAGDSFLGWLPLQYLGLEADQASQEEEG